MIEIYIHALGDEPQETFAYEGNLLSLCEAHLPSGMLFNDLEDQPVEIKINGVVCRPSKWRETEICEDDVVSITAIPNGGAFKVIGALLGGVFKLLFPFLMPNNQSQSGRGGTGQGQALEAADIRANQARMGDIVPIMIGRCRRYGDYLNEPVKRFADRRDQYLSFLVCLSAQSVHFTADDIFVGTTPISQIQGAEFWNHYPNSDLSGHEPAELWHNCDAVGATSSGTTGLVLSALVENQRFVLAPAYELEGGHITPIDGYFPSSWGTNTVFSMVVGMSYWQSTELVTLTNITKFEGNFKHVLPLVAGKKIYYRRAPINSSDPGIELIVRDFDVDSNGDGWVRFNVVEPGNPPTTVPFFNGLTGRDTIAFSQGLSGGKNLFVINSRSGQTLNIEPEPWIPGWQGWSLQENQNVFIQYERGVMYGEYTSPFIGSPAGQRNKIVEVDFFAQNGLRYTDDDGNPQPHSVTVEVEYSDEEGLVSPVLIQYRYEDATPDSIGFTQRYEYPVPVRAKVRVRRIGRISADPRIADEITWYGFRVKMEDKTSYPFHTLSVRIKSGGQLGAQSENQVNVIGTGYGPELLPDGSWSDSVPTSQLASAIYRVATSSGYTADDLHPDILHLSESYWKPRGETFGFVVDGGTVKDALDTILQAGLSELTMEDGFLRPVRDVPRSVFEQGYSPLNITSKSVRVRFNNHRSDDPDGVLVEYLDSNTWETETIKCSIAGDEFRRPRRVKLRGCTRSVAYHYGMRLRLAQEYRRTSYEFDTELDAMNSNYRSYISVIDSLRNYGQAAMATSIQVNEDVAFIKSSEKIEHSAGRPYVLSLRNDVGSIVGPFEVVEVSSDGYTITINTNGTSIPFIDRQQELPHLYFGQYEQWNYPALVESIQPSNGLNVKVKAINYDARVYSYDDVTPGDLNV